MAYKMKDLVPRRCVFEATLGCNLRCRHCGSMAGRPLFLLNNGSRDFRSRRKSICWSARRVQ